MFANSKVKRQVGFIKSYSGLPTFTYNEKDSSSDFSSFEYGELEIGQKDFSPYKHPSPRQSPNQHHSPYLPHFSPKFENEKLRDLSPVIPIPRPQSQLIHQDNPGQLGKISGKRTKNSPLNEQKQISRLSHQQSREPEQITGHWETLGLHKESEIIKETQTGNISPLSAGSKRGVGSIKQNTQFKTNNQNCNRNAGKLRPAKVQRRQHSQIAEKSKQAQAKDTEQLISTYNKAEFNNCGIFKRQILRNQMKKKRHNEAYKTKEKEYRQNADQAEYDTETRQTKSKQKREVRVARGGICYEVDTGQFQSAYMPKENKQRSKKVNLNSKDQIRHRREMAKNYDRLARFRVFGY